MGMRGMGMGMGMMRTAGTGTGTGITRPRSAITDRSRSDHATRTRTTRGGRERGGDARAPAQLAWNLAALARGCARVHGGVHRQGLRDRLEAPSIVDAARDFVVVTILVIGALRLLRDAGLVLLEAAPQHLPVAKVEGSSCDGGVAKVSAVHVWALGTGHDAISAHVPLLVEGSGPRVDGGCDVAKALLLRST